MPTRCGRPLVAVGLICLAALASPLDADADGVRAPKVLLILADDLGYGDLSGYGATDARTPNLDRLATQGVRFTQFYANAPECTPTRTALMTGCYPQRYRGLECAIGVGNVGRYDEAIEQANRHALGLSVADSVLPRALNAVGCTTAIFGKWHLGYEPRFHPLSHGWDRFFGVIGGNMDYYRHREQSPLPVLFEARTPVEREGYATHLFTDAAVAFLEDQPNDQPFFLYVPYTVPHTPIQTPENPDKPITDATWNQGTRAEYVAMVEDMDRQVGRLLKALDHQGLADETLVIFASDNGGTKLADNGPFRGTKGTLFEGGIRVPCIVRAPGEIKPGTVSERPGMTMDLTASILSWSGAELPAGQPLDGTDLIGQIVDSQPEIKQPRFWRYRRGERTWRAVRDGSLKYIDLQDGPDRETWLFDLEDDPGESRNLLDTRAADAKRLHALLGLWEAEMARDR